MRNKILLIFCLLSLPIWVQGGGYQVNLVGVRYIGMGHIGTALSLDAGTIFFNPGNQSFLKDKFSITGSVSALFSYTAFQRTGSPTIERTNNPIAPPFSLFASYKITDKLSAGLGVYTPYGSAVKWNNDWSGQNIVQNIKLQTVLVQPTVSYKITDMISIGAGLVFAYGKVNLNKRVNGLSDSSGNATTVNLKGHSNNWGFNAGIGFKPTEKLSFGFSYRSKINMNVKNGTADFSNVPGSLSSSIPSNNTFNATLPLAANWNFGVSYQFSDKLLIGADFNLVQWKAYDSLIFTFGQNPSTLNQRFGKKYNNGWIVRLGAQYKISDMIIVRAGGYYDNSPVSSNYISPETPDANRIGVSAGLSVFPVERLSIDASFLFVDEFKRSGSYAQEGFSGTYKSLAYIPGIGVTYNF